MNPETPATPTQLTETPTQFTEVLQVSTSPAPEHGVVIGSVTSPSVNGDATANDQGVGVEGEQTVWIGHYSYKNYSVRILLRTVVTIAWLALLFYLGGRGNNETETDHWGWDWFVRISLAAIVVYWLILFWQILIGRLGHRYELTNRRLFVDTGLFRRRRDQMELLKVQDVYVKQASILSRMLDIGTVVIETSEERLPIHYLAGVDHPTPLMDLIWHHARKERDLKSVKVDQV
jgi:membrane protein YdbS with pleckstrin-like domain